MNYPRGQDGFANGCTPTLKRNKLRCIKGPDNPALAYPAEWRKEKDQEEEVNLGKANKGLETPTLGSNSKNP